MRFPASCRTARPASAGFSVLGFVSPQKLIDGRTNQFVRRASVSENVVPFKDTDATPRGIAPAYKALRGSFGLRISSPAAARRKPPIGRIADWGRGQAIPRRRAFSGESCPLRNLFRSSLSIRRYSRASSGLASPAATRCCSAAVSSIRAVGLRISARAWLISAAAWRVCQISFS